MTNKIYINARFLTQKITGVQRFAIEISLVLHQLLGDKIVFLAPHGEMEASDFTKKVPVSSIGRNKGHIWEQIDLPLYLNRINRPLLINLCNAAPIFYKNKISTIHDVAYLRYPKSYSKSFLLLYKLMIPRILKTSRHIFTVSEFSKSEIKLFYPKKIRGKDITVIYNAVDDNFKPLTDPKLNGTSYLVAVSSLNERKNLHAVLTSFVNLNEKKLLTKDIFLYIIGDLKSVSFKTLDFGKYQKHSQIKFLGRIGDQDLVRYYSNAAGFIYPSLYEGFGIPPLEAQKCGCPVIVSNVSSLPEVFGDSALYCDPHNIDSLTKAIKVVLTDKDLKRSLIEKGYGNVARFSWLSSGQRIVEVLKMYF
ncbi:glycosyltransferase family 4 protein [Olivibacter sp. SDN3]|uniref:glycosyltransferase family 4 protein n=1 Tax=Olivibacter sp. SDN3 TaxID=2764720 RepID=UPI0016517E8D|nr:glycosyltransferase family 1 protein [Olivibacter sp. SDN3]QNL52048.1 glycosyltransferase family 4 protein [Olivibacter sp. SDN3]